MSKHKHHFFNTYLTTTMSVALVLLLIGMECVLALSARQLFTDIKENVNLSVVISDDTSEEDSLSITRLLDSAAFCREYSFVSKEKALEDHINNLGEDPAMFLGFNPLQASYEVKLHAEFIHPDSVAKIDSLISAFPFVENVIYQKEMLKQLDHKGGNLSMILLAVAFILLLISVALIINTVRLHVYSHRFTIKTMQLVGAKPWVIKAPIVRRTVAYGMVAAIIALAMIAGIVYTAFYQLGFWLFQITWQNILFLAIVVILSALVITFFSAIFAVNRYIRMKTGDLYAI